MARQLAGMVVAITGASAGIGQALARQLANAGAHVAVGARRVDRLEQLNQECGGKLLVMELDVADADACERFVTATKAHFGRLDTVVCNAGYGLVRTISKTTASDWHALMAVNLYGTTTTIRAALPIMQAQDERDGWRGQVMIVSSCLARRAGAEAGAYSATKAAQLSVAEALRVELKSTHIAVTSVHPIGTTTEFFDQAEARSAKGYHRPKGEPTQTPEQVAERMVRAMRKPIPECWPYPVARWLFSALTLFPGWADRLAAKRYRSP